MHKYTNTTTRSVIWFKKANDSGELIIKPPFQRNPVWSRRQQTSLIDTILKEYPIPEIYMQEITEDTGNQRHVLVDGQQRIRAILEFCAGDYELEEEAPQHEGLTFDDLAPDDKKRLYEYNFIVRLLPDIPDTEIRAIFQRLNKNTMELNAQELRHATYWGPFIKLMEELADHPFWSESGIFSANDLRRMKDVEFISEITIAYINGLQNKKKNLEDYYQQYEQSFEQADEIRSLFIKVLGEISQVIPTISKTRWKKKSDFYSLFLVMAQWANLFPLSEEKRRMAGVQINHFGNSVDALIREEAGETVDPAVATYVKNVERAASDLAARRERARLLTEVLKTVVSG